MQTKTMRPAVSPIKALMICMSIYALFEGTLFNKLPKIVKK